jgi:hypothetical protein
MTSAHYTPRPKAIAQRENMPAVCLTAGQQTSQQLSGPYTHSLVALSHAQTR